MDLNGTGANGSHPLTPHPALVIFCLAGLIGIGLLGIFGSATVTLVILCHKTLRTPCFELIAAGSVGSCLVAVYHVTNGVLVIVTGVFGLETIRWQCSVINISGLWGIPFHSLMICFVGFDRLHSLVAPVRHRQLGVGYVWGVVCGCAVFVTGLAIGGLVSTPQNIALKSCQTLDDIVSVSFMEVYRSLNLLFYSMAVCVYVSIMVCCYCRSKQVDGSDLESTVFAQHQSLIMPTVRLMIILYFVCGLLGEVFINSVLRMEPSQTVYFVRAVGINLKVMCSLVEIFSLLLRSTKFRECFKKSMSFKSPQQVAPFIIAWPSHSRTVF